MVDPLQFQMSRERPHRDRPWVMANFVSTIDGATAVQGGATAISDEDDATMFQAIRAVSDYIVVGAGTVRAENYGPVVLDEERIRLRKEAGLDPRPGLVVVTRSLELAPEHRMFTDSDRRVMVVTGRDAPQDRLAALSAVADVVTLASTRPEHILGHLGPARIVLCEGGPTLFGQFVTAGLVDEMALTIAPMMVAGQSRRVAEGDETVQPIDMRLDSVLHGDRSLFLRYVRR